jgi:hypothetical protein
VSRTHRIIQIGWPEFGQAAYPPQTSSAELEQRVHQLRARMEERIWSSMGIANISPTWLISLASIRDSKKPC